MLRPNWSQNPGLPDHEPHVHCLAGEAISFSLQRADDAWRSQGKKPGLTSSGTLGAAWNWRSQSCQEVAKAWP